MKVRTELSGFGHYGICTILPSLFLLEILEVIENSPYKDSWQNFDFDPGKPSGIDGSFRTDCGHCVPDETKFCWSPSKTKEALLSQKLLMRGASYLESKNPDKVPKNVRGKTLEIFPEGTSDGWNLQANFSDEVWDTIESPDFISIIPKINTDIRFWQEEQSGVRTLGQYTTLFNGKDGPTLQVYQPNGNGLWIAGSRKRDMGNQFTDHNTDFASHAFIHTLSLCIVLDHCRKIT